MGFQPADLLLRRPRSATLLRRGALGDKLAALKSLCDLVTLRVSRTRGDALDTRS